MASIQQLRELSAALQSIKGDSGESVQALSKLSQELEIFIQRAERLRGEKTDFGLIAGIGGSEAELAATRRNLGELTQGFKEVNAASSGAFTGMVNQIRAAVQNLDILNIKQREVYQTFAAGVDPTTTIHPSTQRHGLGGSADPTQLRAISDYLRNVTTDSKEAKIAVSQFADQLDKVAEKMLVLSRSRPGQFALGGGRAVGFTEKELGNLERGLRMLENLRSRGQAEGERGPFYEYAQAVREAIGSIDMAADSQRKFLDTLGFRDIGTSKLADIITRINAISTSEEDATTKAHQLALALKEISDIGIQQFGLLGGTFAPDRPGALPDEGISPSLERQTAISPMLGLVEGDKLSTEFQVISGSVEDLGRVLGKNEQLMKAVQTGVDHLEKEFRDAGLEADRFTVKIDAANKALEITASQAEAGVKAPAALKGVLRGDEIAAVQDINESVRVGLGDAAVIDRAKELQQAFTNIGASAAGVKNLETSLKSFGLTLSDIQSASYDANEGIIRFSASADAGAGITRRANIVMNRQGDIVETVKRKYEGLGGAITNNINKVVRWGIAVGLVYGSMSKLRQAMTEMIDLETSFADITIITGKSVEELGNAFDAIVEAAQATGISLSEATAAFEKALRAAGRTADEAERVAKAEALMTDALILARLANVDQAQAMDMLTGALRQQGLEIDQGQQLLDKWVATSKTAFVGLEDLAESFAITAAQARAVGVEVDQLNGIIGAIAEVTTLSSTEIGNFARTILSALESDAAIKTLQEYGIAVKDVAGDLRDWGEVMQDVYDFWRTGAISDRELSAIGRVLGGGARRGPQFVAFLKEYGRVNEIAAKSADASGDAAEALDIKMDTLRNTINELSVAFSTLAASVGEEGGLLEFMTNLTKLTTGAINILGDLTDILGDTTTQVLALTVAYATLSKAGVFQRIGGVLAGGAAAGGATQLGLPGLGAGPQAAGLARTGTTMGSKAVAALRSAAPTIGTGIGVGAITYMTTGSIIQGVGAGIGGAIGSVLAGPVGMLAGSAIGNVIGGIIEDSARVMRDYEDIVDIVERDDELGMPEVVKGLTTILDKQRNMFERIRDIGPEIPLEGESRRLLENWSIARPEDIVEAARILRQSLQEDIEGFAARGIVDTEWIGLLQREIDTIDDLIGKFEEHKKAIEENTAALEEELPSRYAEELGEARRRYAPAITQQLEGGRAERIQQFAAGEIPRASYTRFLQVSEQLPQTIAQIMVLLEDEMAEAFGTGIEAVEEMTSALDDMDPAAITFIQERLAKLQSVRADIDALGDSIGNTAIEMEYAVAMHREYSELAVQTSEEILALIENAKAAAAEPIRPQFARYEDLTGGEFDQIYQQALANQREYAEFVGLTSQEIADAADDWIYVVEGGLGEMSGLWKLFFDDALQKFQEARDRMQEEEFHVRRLQDVDPGKIGEIQARNRYWIEYLSRLQGLTSEQYLAKEGYQENLILGPNNVWQKILTTNEAMNFVLQDILETEKKQLEGMWNIPEGATFWVPLTSLFYQDKGGEGGIPELPPIDESLIKDLEEAEDRGLDIGAITGDARPKEVFLTREEAAKRFNIDLPEAEVPAERSVEELENLRTVVEFLRQQALDKDMKPTEFFKYIADTIAEGQVEKDAGAEQLYTTVYDDLIGLLRPLIPSAATDEEIADYLLEAATTLLESLQNIAPGGTGAEPVTDIAMKVGDAATRALDTITTYFGAPLELNAQFQIESEKALMIQNVVTLDGSVIKAWISEIIAQEVAKSAKATGFSATLMSG